jgi:hypothetical protein
MTNQPAHVIASRRRVQGQAARQLEEQLKRNRRSHAVI